MLSLGLTSDAVLCYLLPNFSSILKDIEKKTNCGKVEAQAVFCPNSESRFLYKKGKDGVKADTSLLLKEILSGKKRIQLPVTFDKALSVEKLKALTAKRAEFSTSFANSKENRAHNVMLALSFFNGLIVQPNESVSFNKTVGARTAHNGYKQAKIIVDGKYVDGVGGGVCQVSTTLYNALLLADVQVISARAHTLLPSYVMPSFDAMVSYGSSDLVFCNNTSNPIYICAYAHNKQAKVEIYGEKMDYLVKRRSVSEKVPFLTVIKYDSEQRELLLKDGQKILTRGIDGAKSTGYLQYYQNGELIKEVFLRKDSYKAVNEVVLVGEKNEPTLLEQRLLLFA